MSTTLSGINRNHRTLLVIDARGGFNGESKERVNRLLESVNGNNIKVDIAHLTGGVDGGFSPASPVQVVPGLPSALTGSVADVPAISGSVYENIVAEAKNLGYVQTLISATR